MTGPPLEPPPEPPITAAARVGDVTQVRLLIASGADVDERYEFSDAHLPQSGGISGRTALGAAVYAGHAAVVHVLIEGGANLNVVDDAGFTPLLIAVFRRETEIVAELLAAGDLMLEQRALLGRTALILASGIGLYGVVSLLLNAGADVGARDDIGRTALAWAKSLGHTSVASLLKQYGAPE